jgi:hypothetical protein
VYGDLVLGRVEDDLNLYAYVGNDPLDRTDPSGETCSQNNGTYTCQVDSMKDAKGNVTQRADFSKAQVKQVAAFEKSYTAAVNKLASHASDKASIAVPGGKEQTVTAGSVARSAANRVVEAMPSVTQTTAEAVTHGDSMGGVMTTVNAAGLRGAPLVPGAANAEQSRQMVVVHEAMHGTYLDNSMVGIKNFQEAHQIAYDQAALKLLNGDE